MCRVLGDKKAAKPLRSCCPVVKVWLRLVPG